MANQSELVTERQEKVMPPCPVIDAHAHFGRILFGENYEQAYDTAQVVSILKEMGIEKIVSLELDWDEEYDRMLRKIKGFEDFIVPFGSVNIRKALEPGFESLVYRQIRYLKERGCQGIKLWKDITVYGDTYFGTRLRLDDERFSPVFDICGQEHLPIIIHIADPPSFFKPIDENNEHFQCLSMHPEWSFYKEGMFSFEEHMEMQEHLLERHPDVTFVIAHVGSYAENLGQVSKWLDRYPNMYVDISARLDQLGRQPYSSRRFLQKYQDRVLFGTDFEARFSPERIRSFYDTHYRFLQTEEEYFDHPFADMLGQWKIYGVNLEPDVLKKIYHDNAQRILGL